MSTKLQDIIQKANIIHNYKYDYNLITSYTKMIDYYTIICKIHGNFQQTLHKHLLGNGCKQCGTVLQAQKKTEKCALEFREKSIKIHGGKYDYSKVVYTKAIEDVIIVCPKHGDFSLTPNGHLNGKGCQKCGRENISKKLMYPLEKYLEEVNLIHNNIYDYSKVVWTGSDNNIIVICNIHGEFIIRACEHRNRGCQKCSKETRIYHNELTTEEFIKRHKEKHGETTYDYSITFYQGINQSINIVCYIHGEYNSIAVNYAGCKKCCMKEYNNEGEHKLTYNNFLLLQQSKIDFVSKSKLIHREDNYDYTKVNYINVQTKVIIICKIHGEFTCSPNNHLRGKGCPECGKEKSRLAVLNPYEEYYNEFIRLYNDKYDYSKVEWKGGSFLITVLCKKHGEFNIYPYHHRNGKECPKCSNQHSKISIVWLSFMEIKYGVNICHAKNKGEYVIPNSRYKADGYAESINTIFEFNGDFWHGNPKLYDMDKLHPRAGVTFRELYQKTVEKSNFIKNNGYSLVEIWEHDWKKFIKAIIKIQRKWRSKR